MPCQASNGFSSEVLSRANAYVALDACRNKSCTTSCLCAASDSDNECLGCVKSNCRTDFGAFVNTPDYDAFNKCVESCAADDADCFDACVTAFPTAAAAYDSLINNCLASACSAQCT